VPSQTAPQIVARLNVELRKGLQHPDMRNALEKVAAEPIGNSPQDARIFVQQEFAKWAAVVKAGNVRPE
jgi:tripartite-type tricarboxylate transporter receptor subunit TctC